MNNKLICFILSILYIIIAYKIGPNTIGTLIIVSIFFGVSICLLLYLISFIGKKSIKATIIKANYGISSSTDTAKNSYTLKYIIDGKEYEKRLNYTTSSHYNIGDEVIILVNKDNSIILEDDFWFLLAALFILLPSFIIPIFFKLVDSNT